MSWTEITILVKKAQQGDKLAYGELVKRFQASVYAMALTRVHDPLEAEELAQEVFVHGMKKLPQLRDQPRGVLVDDLAREQLVPDQHDPRRRRSLGHDGHRIAGARADHAVLEGVLVGLIVQSHERGVVMNLREIHPDLKPNVTSILRRARIIGTRYQFGEVGLSETYQAVPFPS